jgi:HEAT repeat protein
MANLRALTNDKQRSTHHAPGEDENMKPRPIIIRRVIVFAALALSVVGIARAADSPYLPTDTEGKLIDVLRANSKPEKAIACKKLAIHGTKAAVPDLAKLLADEQLASWARIALEAIPDPAADEALREATKTLKGKLLVGAINSIGVRRSATAVNELTMHLKDDDSDAAAAAAVALGHIGDAASVKALREALTATVGRIRDAVAEGCILAAERMLNEGKSNDAKQVYDEVRRAGASKEKTLEATRGAILARGSQGIPLLVDQLRSADKGYLQIGLGAARELPGREVSAALANEISKASPDRAVLLIAALADRDEHLLPTAILEVAKSGPKSVRIAAIEFIGRVGDEDSLATLLEIAADADSDLAKAAKTVLAALPGDKVNREIVARLPKAEGDSLTILIELVGQRRIRAIEPLVNALANRETGIRQAALNSLGETIDLKDLRVLVAQVVAPKHSEDAEAARRALLAACVRMPDREACAAELAAAMASAPDATKVQLLEILGAVGGQTSLDTIAAAVKTGRDALEDAGTRVLGEWMTADAGPVLLDLAKNAAGDKYQIRSLRGYIRLARQFDIPDRDRAEMVRLALKTSKRPDEQRLALTALEHHPSIDGLRVAIEATKISAIKADASQTAALIAQKLGGKSADAEELLKKAGIEPAKIEIIKATYGAGATQQDVTAAIKRHVHGSPVIALPSSNYNETFGGDPVPNTPKQLKIEYRLNDKPGEASFAENAAIVLPVPK